MMEDVDLDGLELREIIAYARPGGVFRPGDYPWLAAVRIIAKAGSAGGRQNGEDGSLFIELYAAPMVSSSPAVPARNRLRRLWGDILQGLDEVLHPTIRIPNPAYYWRRWRRG